MGIFSNTTRIRFKIKLLKLKDSRKARRAAKDEVLMLENIVKFFEEPQNRKVLNQMGQLLGRQKKQEKMLLSERTYTPRVKEG